jgi:hypothetical protein
MSNSAHRPTPERRRASIVLSAPLHEKLVRASQRHHRTISGELAVAIERHIAEPRLSDGQPRELTP